VKIYLWQVKEEVVGTPHFWFTRANLAPGRLKEITQWLESSCNSYWNYHI